MPLVVKDRVMETTSSTGTGTITLGGAVAGYQSFSAIGDGNTTYYTIVGGTEWEVGIGTYTASGTTLSRDTVLESSNSGSLVNFSSGTKNVFVTYPAEESVDQDTAQTLTNKTLSVDNNTISGIATSSFVLSNASGNIDGAAAQKAIPSGVVVGTTDSQTLTNKTISGASNTLSNIANSSLTNSDITINGTPISLGGSINVGTVTSVTGTAPVVSSGGNTPDISMAQANSTTNGFLSSTDWNTFNNKGSGTVTSVSAGNGMSFTTITDTGSVAMGTPSSVTNSSTNSVSSGTHTHALSNVAFANMLASEWNRGNGNPGYFELPSGIYVQFGSVAIGGTSGSTAVTYAVTYPNTTLAVYASQTNNAGDGNVHANVTSNSQITVSKTAMSTNTTTIYWLSIGY